MAFSYESMPSSNKILSAAASVTASIILFKSISNDLIPNQIHTYFSSCIHKISSRLSSQSTVVIEEFEGLTPNHMFEAANIYLGTRISPSTQRIKVLKSEKDQEFTVTVDKNQDITDVHAGSKFSWILQSTQIKQAAKSDRNGSIRTEFREIKEEKKEVGLHTVDYNGTDYWSSVTLNHPATLDSMTMDPDAKQELINDLRRFISRKDYYRRVGKAWKRGYLFFGPPGTGKSSLVAAMANYLKFDVYDLDIKEVQCNSDLRRLLIGTASTSILVIEDVDCNVGLQNREAADGEPDDEKITLSGLLNFIDGLWSSCGDERIIIFTTNHKDRLDPALLRPGRMDVHIEMSYCAFSGFGILAFNYLQIEEHKLFPTVQELLNKIQATPAEIAGELMKSDDPDTALQCLITYLENKQTRT